MRIAAPGMNEQISDESLGEAFPGRYWHTLDDGRVQCDLCPRLCKLHMDA